MTNPAASSALAGFDAARELLLRLRTDQAAAVAQFRWPVLAEFNWALDHFDRLGCEGSTADAPALWIVGEDGVEVRRSFRELGQRSARLANWLRGIGVQRGDALLVMLGNELALWETMLAAIKLGAVLIPATALLTTEDLRDRFERGGVRHVVAGHAQAAKFAPLPGDYSRIAVGAPAGSALPAGWLRFEDSEGADAGFAADAPTRADDPLLLYFTSGTTSRPKLVLHTHQSYPVGHLSTMYWLGLRPGDVHLNISSPGWAKHAWSCFFAPWNAGACVFIHNSARFDARGLLATLERCGVTSLCAPPTVWRMLVQQDLAAYRGRLALRELIGAGEPLNPEVIEQVRSAWGLTVRDGYGQTETTAQIGNPPGQPLKPGSMGRPLPGYRIVLLDVDGNPADEGEVCIELAERPLGLMAGYQDSAEKNAEAMRGGRYHTGDVASRDADGYITFVGRADDVFKASDYRISPFELESALIEHPAIAEVAVVPSPDPLRLAVPKAFVLLAPGAQPSRALAGAVFAFVRERLAPYKRVRRIQFVAELPKTISGKIRRVDLRAQEARQRDAPARAGEEYFEEDFAADRRATTTRTPAWYDTQYNNRARIPAHPAILQGWADDSAAARSRLRDGVLDIAYGSEPSERLDVFPARTPAAPVLVFIHGGYWRALDKRDASFIAPPFVDAGAMVVVPNYALCPAVSMAHIVAQMTQALAWVYRHAAEHGGDRSRIVVAGHSAGGHLAATLLATDWPAVAPDLPAGLVGGALAISGLFDLEPLRHAPFIAADIGLTEASARALSPANLPRPASGRLVALVGGDESEEFHRQNALLGERWGREVVIASEAVPGRNHMDVLNELAVPDSMAQAWGLRLLGLV